MAVEELGYPAIWVAGGQLATLDPLLRILRATTRVAVVPGIIPLDVHGPGEIAKLYAEAEGIAPGRLVVGIGGPQRLQTGAIAALPRVERPTRRCGVRLGRRRSGGSAPARADRSWSRPRGDVPRSDCGRPGRARDRGATSAEPPQCAHRENLLDGARSPRGDSCSGRRPASRSHYTRAHMDRAVEVFRDAVTDHPAKGQRVSSGSRGVVTRCAVPNTRKFGSSGCDELTI